METTLKSCCLTCPEDEWIMAMPLDAVNLPGAIPQGLEIKRIASTAQVEQFADVLSAATAGDETIRTFYTDAKDAITAPSSPLRLYIGYIGSEPAAVVEAISAHGILNFYQTASAASFRSKGYAAALVLTALRDAKKLGVRLASLQTVEASRAAYEKFGFKPAGRIVNYR